MITGFYDMTMGAFLTASIYFPDIDEIIDVSFLVDTGASRTLLMPSDILRIREEDRLTSKSEPTNFRGVGGSVSVTTIDAVLMFLHDSGDMTTFLVELNLLKDAAASDLPSLLGREILQHGTLIFDHLNRQILFDAQLGHITVTVE